MTALSQTMIDIIDARVQAALDKRALRLVWGTVQTDGTVLLDGDTVPLPATTPSLVDLVPTTRVAVDRQGLATRIVGTLGAAGAVRTLAHGYAVSTSSLTVPFGSNTAVPGLTVTVTNPLAVDAQAMLRTVADVESTTAGYGVAVGNFYVDGSPVPSGPQVLHAAAAGTRLTIGQLCRTTIAPGEHTYDIRFGKLINGGAVTVAAGHSTLEVSVLALSA